MESLRCSRLVAARPSLATIRAARAVAAEGGASVSLVQRKFNVGYSRAGRIVDMLAEHRVIGGYQGSKSREVLMNLPDVDELLERLGLE